MSSPQPAATVLLATHVAGHLLDGKAVRASEAAAFQSALGEAAIRSIGGMQPNTLARALTLTLTLALTLTLTLNLTLTPTPNPHPHPHPS